jgi:hypothetical protein
LAHEVAAARQHPARVEAARRSSSSSNSTSTRTSDPMPSRQGASTLCTQAAVTLLLGGGTAAVAIESMRLSIAGLGRTEPPRGPFRLEAQAAPALVTTSEFHASEHSRLELRYARHARAMAARGPAPLPVSCQIAYAVALILLIRRLATPWRQQIGPGFGSLTSPCLGGLHLPSENSTAH